ncbi:IS5 family transposase [Sporolactobacillus sp. CQH2019]|uniref:IS5 family transposase n=1 Tax=Sporolactobacillus sp. CQH2019 TaxID=3023512 RepID=UPI002367F4B2|nr:IS5 family transposase [Sporolactobacillus sp. CQH2019]MDD9148840.1 IS5 family transposase [Sporolactobacillus sp. CQH2019]
MVYRTKTVQLSIDSFGQELGVSLSPHNQWVQLANQLPWTQLEALYLGVFPSTLGRAGKPFRLLYGAQLIKQSTGLSDVDLVNAVRDTPAYQYFMGCPTYNVKLPFNPSSLSHFRKRIAPISARLRQVIGNWCKDRLQDSLGDEQTMILDATVTPVNIRFPQDSSLLNQARTLLEKIITELAHQLHVPIPRTYKREAHKGYVTFTRKPRRSARETRKQVKAQLQYVRRDLRYVRELREKGGELTDPQLDRLDTIQHLFEQQEDMYRHQTHRVDNRIVSLAQPYVRPIKRGKARQDTEFGPKIDVSIQDGILEIERVGFNAFNESMDFQKAIARYAERHGHYPDEVLADKLYRNRKNIAFAKERGIKILGPKLGRKPKPVDEKQRRAENAAARDAENRRGQIERSFSFIKRKCGLGLVRAKTAETIAISIDTGIAMANIDAVLRLFSWSLLLFVQIKEVHLKISYQTTEWVKNSVA